MSAQQYQINPSASSVVGLHTLWLLSYACVFRAWHLGLDNLTGGSSLERTDFSLSQQLLIACSSSSRGGAWRNSPHLMNASTVQSCRVLDSRVVEVLWVRLPSRVRDTA